ncbi:unnamed protein product [Lota lota]
MGSSHFLFFLWGLCGVLGASGFRICAFNLHGFGESKANNAIVMSTLVKIIARCDVCVLQEVRDSKNTAVSKLLSQLNSFDRTYTYGSLASERLGRSTAYQEQYVFVYRTETAAVTGQYQYPDTLDGSLDAFAREPFVVRFSAPGTTIKEFVLIPVHTSPANATREIDSLYDVFIAVQKKWKNKNVMFLGDFNADCSYLPKKNRGSIRLLTDESFLWLIGDDSDTTVRESTDCAYDRIVVHGNAFSNAIVPLSAEPFIFPAAYELTEEQALSVSDHYPVQVSLKSGSPRSSVQVSLGIVVHGNAFSNAIVPLSAEPFIFPVAYELTEEQALSVSDHYPVQVSLKSGSPRSSVQVSLGSGSPRSSVQVSLESGSLRSSVQVSLESGSLQNPVLTTAVVLVVCWATFN